VRHRAPLLVAVLIGVALLTLAPQAASAAVSSERCSKLLASISSQPAPDPNTIPEECRQQYEQQQKSQTPAPSTPTSQAPTPSASPAKPKAQAEPEEPKVFKDFVPNTSAEEWAMEAGRSTDDLLGDLNRALGDSPKTLGTGFAAPYAVAWGIGLVLMAFVITVTSGQAAGGAERRAQLESAGWRAWTYYPAMLIVPTVAYQLYAMAAHLAGWFGGQGAPARALVFRMVQQRLWEAASPAMLLGGGTLVALFLLGLMLAFAFLTLVEVALAKYGLFLLLCFVPPMAALAIHPRFRPALARLTGAIVGALLVPAVLMFGFWVSMSIASDTLKAEKLDKEGTLSAFALVLICLIVASVVPLLMALVMPKVVAGIAGDENAGTRRSLGDLGARARMEGRMAANGLARTAGRAARPRMSPAAGGAASAAAKAGSAGAVTKAAAAASGPAAPVTAAVGASLQAGVGAMRSAYRGAKSRLGGGGRGGSGRGGGAGGVGRVPSSPAQGSSRPASSGPTGGGGSAGSARPTPGGASSQSAASQHAGVGAPARGPSFRPPSEGAR